MGSNDVTVTSLDKDGQIVETTEPMNDSVKEPEKAEPKKVAEPEAKVEEPAKVEPAVEEPKEVELEAKEEPVTEESPKKGKSRFETRKASLKEEIQSLVREKNFLQGEKAQLEKQLDNTRQAPTPIEETKPVADSKEPKEEDYEVYNDYLDARSDWRTDKRWKEHEEQQAKQTDDAARQKAFDAYNERVSRATEVYPDWVEVMDQVTKPLPLSAQIAIVELENSPEVMYYLAKDAELREKLSGMTDLGQVLAIGRISQSLSKTENKATEPSTPVENPAQTKATSHAPKPITPVGAGATKTHLSLDDENVSSEEFNRRREKGEV